MRSTCIRAARAIGLGAGITITCVAAAASALAASSNPPTLIASQHVAGLPAVVYTTSIVLSGRASLGATTVELQANPFPFKQGFHTIATAHTGSNGKYRFKVSPGHATRYQVRLGAGGPSSRVLTVYVLEKTIADFCNLCTNSNGAGPHTLDVRHVLVAPPGPLAQKGPAYFYYQLVTGTSYPATLTLRKKVALEISMGKATVAATYRVNFPAGVSFRFSSAVCWKDAEAKDGVGLPGHHHCGDETVRRGEYLG